MSIGDKTKIYYDRVLATLKTEYVIWTDRIKDHKERMKVNKKNLDEATEIRSHVDKMIEAIQELLEEFKWNQQKKYLDT